MNQMCFVDVLSAYDPAVAGSKTYGMQTVPVELLAEMLVELRKAHEWEVDSAFDERENGGLV